jgi:hypothetical protein
VRKNTGGDPNLTGGVSGCRVSGDIEKKVGRVGKKTGGFTPGADGAGGRELTKMK